jgi:hypothetical protein
MSRGARDDEGRLIDDLGTNGRPMKKQEIKAPPGMDNLKSLASKIVTTPKAAVDRLAAAEKRRKRRRRDI